MNNSGKKGAAAVYTRRIERQEQSSYVEIPFEMPAGVEELHVSYEVQSHGEAKAVIDLGVRDVHRVRGWSGGARSGFRIGREQATPGYLPGGLEPGGWAVLHNAYQVPEEGCTVTVTVELVTESPRWLKGDLHMHSVHSDGSFTLEENAAEMERLGCDFLAMTDHNTCSQNFAYPRGTGLVMIPGMEVTTNFGHANLLGVADPLDDFRVAGQEDVNRRLRTARERGASIVLNHPHCDYCPWLWDFTVDHDWVEVWNGPWRESNNRALQWWDGQLRKGRRLVAVGGSDTHRPDPFVRHGSPTTFVYAESRTVQGILAGIAKGRVCMAYGPQGPFVELGCGEYMTGDVVPVIPAGHAVSMRAKGVRAGDRVRLISDRGLEREWVTAAQDLSEVPLEEKFTATGRKYVRAEVWRCFEEAGGALLLAAMTNPIYFGESI